MQPSLRTHWTCRVISWNQNPARLIGQYDDVMLEDVHHSEVQLSSEAVGAPHHRDVPRTAAMSKSFAC
jgi:hypothetical protein